MTFFKQLSLRLACLSLVLVTIKVYTDTTMANAAQSTVTSTETHQSSTSKNTDSTTSEKQSTTKETTPEEPPQPSYEDMVNTRNDRWEEVSYDFANFEDIYAELTYPLAKIIYAEGGGQNDECQQYIGYVVINRIESKYYPDSLSTVFFSGGYAKLSQKKFMEDRCSERAIKNACIVVNNYYNGTIPVSPALVYQSGFTQGVNHFVIDGESFGYDERILRDLKN